MNLTKEPTTQLPNPLKLQSGDIAIMGEEYDTPTEVSVVSIGYSGFLAIVKEVKTNKRWTLSIGLLSRKSL